MAENSGEDDFTLQVDEALIESFLGDKTRLQHLASERIQFQERDKDFTLRLIQCLDRAVEMLEQYMESEKQSLAMRWWVYLGKSDDESH